MNNRRTFLKQSGVLALGALTANTFANTGTQPIGLQLFTFFPSFDQDVKGNLEKIKAVGFQELESAFSMKGGFYGMTAKEFASITKETGLAWRSHHVIGAPLKPNPKYEKVTSQMPKFKTLKNEAQELVDTVAEAGIKYMVCAGINHETADDVKEAVVILSKAGEMAKKAGLTFCYHNHASEFHLVGNERPYDVFMSQISPDLMKFELDLAWASEAKIDIPALFKQHEGRFPLVHVKDFDKDFKNLMPVGEGVIDFKTIFESAKVGGIKHYFVEHDMPKDAIASVTSSFGYLKKLL
jgi:sugar phosphate isomerase/epimerase